MLEYRVPLQQRLISIFLYTVLGFITYPGFRHDGTWLLSIVLWSGFILMMAGAVIELRFVLFGNPPVWRIVDNALEVRTWFKRTTFSLDSVTIAVVGGSSWGSTVLSDRSQRITLTSFELPVAQRAVLAQAIPSSCRRMALT
jgi:hypothetical protein